MAEHLVYTEEAQVRSLLGPFKMKKVNRNEGIFAIVAALFVLFSSLWDPLVSTVIAIAALAGFAIWEFMKR